MWADHRFAGSNQLWVSPPKDAFVRVPDQVLKTAVFLGVDGPRGREYGGTGYIVSVDYGPGQVLHERLDGITTVSRYPFRFLVTAAHVAEELEGAVDFYIRANLRDGSLAELKQQRENARWWYHPTEREAVDCAAMLLPLETANSLDIASVPVTMFVSDEIVKSANLGVGDEVFIAGLFTKAQGIDRNIPIVRIGNVAMMPNEKIPFPTRDKPNQSLYADLLESRSIGGLSGSPVFIRETLRLRVHADADGNVMSGLRYAINGVDINASVWDGEMQGLGRFHFFGSVVGHWGVAGLSSTQREAVNMGIAPMVPAQRILEVIGQQEVLDTMSDIHYELRRKQEEKDGAPVMDSAFQPKQKTEQDFEIPIPSRDEFFGVLKKASRKIKPEEQ